MLSLNTGGFFGKKVIINEQEFSKDLVLKKEMDAVSVPVSTSTGLIALINQAWEKIKHLFSAAENTKATFSALVMSKISYDATSDASEKLEYQVDALHYFTTLKNMAGPAKQENFVCIHKQNSDMVTLKIYPDDINENSIDIDEDSPYANSAAAPIFEFTFRANEFNTTNVNLQQTWNDLKHCFKAENQVAAGKIFLSMWEKDRALNQDIDSMAELAQLAHTGHDKFQINVTSNTDSSNGKVKVELALGQFKRSETCDAHTVVGSLMGYENADTEKIAEQTSPTEKALLAKFLVTVHSSRVVDLDLRRKEFAAIHTAEFYKEYRPDDTHREAVAVKRDLYDVTEAHFGGDFRRCSFALNHKDEDARTVFTNIGYRKNADGTVQFSMVHPALRLIAQSPVSRLRLTKDSPHDATVASSANSIFYDVLNTDYDLFHEHIDISQPALAKFFYDHDETLNVSVGGLTRNCLPIGAQ